MLGWFAPPTAAVTLLTLKELTTDVLISCEGPTTLKSTVPRVLIALTPIFEDRPPPILY